MSEDQVRKDELLKLIADELIVLDQSRERALLAEKNIAAWRSEYDDTKSQVVHRSFYGGPSVHPGDRDECNICPPVPEEYRLHVGSPAAPDYRQGEQP